MSKKPGGDEAASALAQKRWAKTSLKERREHARMMNEARWGGRRKTAKKKAAK